MADLTRRAPQRASSPFERFEPLRTLRDLMRWDPFAELEPVAPAEAAFLPSVEVRETADALLFKMDVPGVRQEDVEVSMSGNRLTVSGKREEEQRREEDRYFMYERSYGTFTRSFTLPDNVDANNVRADLREGVLTLSIPKKTGAEARRIPVGTTAPQMEAGKEKEKETGKEKAEPGQKKAA